MTHEPPDRSRGRRWARCLAGALVGAAGSAVSRRQAAARSAGGWKVPRRAASMGMLACAAPPLPTLPVALLPPTRCRGHLARDLPALPAGHARRQGPARRPARVRRRDGAGGRRPCCAVAGARAGPGGVARAAAAGRAAPAEHHVLRHCAGGCGRGRCVWGGGGGGWGGRQLDRPSPGVLHICSCCRLAVPCTHALPCSPLTTCGLMSLSLNAGRGAEGPHQRTHGGPDQCDDGEVS